MGKSREKSHLKKNLLEPYLGELKKPEKLRNYYKQNLKRHLFFFPVYKETNLAENSNYFLFMMSDIFMSQGLLNFKIEACSLMNQFSLWKKVLTPNFFLQPKQKEMAL